MYYNLNEHFGRERERGGVENELICDNKGLVTYFWG